VRSEGLEEKHQAVIKGATLMMNRSAKDGARSSPHYGGEGVLVHPSYQGVCGWHGTEDSHVTHGGLVSTGGRTEMDRWVNVVGMVVAEHGHPVQTSSATSKVFYKVNPK